MRNFLLTIALPVFNDAKALQLTISSVLKSRRNFAQDIEIIVYDNCSFDDGFAVATNALFGQENSRVLRHRTNVGFGQNLVALANESKGDYLWFIGAGDTVEPNQLPKVLQLLESRRPDFCVVHGLFNFHSYWNYEPPAQVLEVAKRGQASSAAVFNHAVSLNIMRRSVMMGYEPPLATSTSENFGHTGEKPTDSLTLYSPKADYWPHLDAICQ